MSPPRRVLVIEDHDDTRKIVEYVLRRENCTVHAYDRCADAEKHLIDGDIDVALLDVRLPDRCGDDFAKELRLKFPKTKIVFLTAEADINPLKVAVPDCFVIRKPFDVAVLVELIKCHDPETTTE